MPKTRGIQKFNINEDDRINNFINSQDITPISIAISGSILYILYEEEYYSQEQ